MGLSVVTPALAAPVSLDEFKAHLRIETDWTKEDADLQRILDAATASVQTALRRQLISAQYLLTIPEFPRINLNLKIPRDRFGIELPLGQLQTVDSVKYYDTANAVQTLASSVYEFDAAREPAVIVLGTTQSWPATYIRVDAVQVTFTCGYGPAATDVPEDIRHAILLAGAHWYAQREMVAVGTLVSNIQRTVDYVVRAYAIPRVG